jgi:hypothetical protein
MATAKTSALALALALAGAKDIEKMSAGWYLDIRNRSFSLGSGKNTRRKKPVPSQAPVFPF